MAAGRNNMGTNMADYADDCSEILDDFTSGAEIHHSPILTAPLQPHPQADTSPVTTTVRFLSHGDRSAVLQETEIQTPNVFE
ncbi:Hypothetical predicted protein, partial [Pelobates cultripes]